MNEQMSITILALTGLAWLDVAAIRSAIRAGMYSRVQLVSQAVVAILFPVVGALLVIYLANGEDREPSRESPDARAEPENVRVQNPNYEDI